MKNNTDTLIVPAILERKILDIQTKVGLVSDIVPLVQLDICDGVFTPTITWPFTGSDTAYYDAILHEEDGLPYWAQVNYELDLMVSNAHTKFFSDWIRLGPSHIVFHLEAEEKKSFLTFLENLEPFYKESIKIGIAINTMTDVETLSDFVPHVSFIQCMGIEHIGIQGSQFDDRVVGQIRKIHALFPDTPVTVDGGVTFESIKILAPEGVSRFVVGSAIFKSFDALEAVASLKALVGKTAPGMIE